jgi:hypothetical protein
MPAFSRHDSIPTVNGKVTFDENIRSILLQKDIHDRIMSYVNNYLKPVEGYVVKDRPDMIVCNITDYIVVSSQMMQTFAMYMNYSATFRFYDSLCVMRISDICFMEKEAFEKQKKWDTNPNSYLNYPKSDTPLLPVYSAEQIFLDREYNLVFYNKASQRITRASIYRIEEVFEEINDALTLPDKELERLRKRLERANMK